MFVLSIFQYNKKSHLNAFAVWNFDASIPLQLVFKEPKLINALTVVNPNKINAMIINCSKKIFFLSNYSKIAFFSTE